MARNPQTLFIAGELYSRTGKALSIEVEKRGRSIGLVIEQAKRGDRKRKEELKVDTKALPKKVEEILPRIQSCFHSVSREQREKVLGDNSPKPCVGHYSPNHDAVERSNFHPFIKSCRSRAKRVRFQTQLDSPTPTSILCDRIVRNMKRNRMAMDRIREEETRKLKEFQESKGKEEESASINTDFDRYSSPAFSQRKEARSQLQEEVPQEDPQIKLGYRVKYLFGSHHIVGTKQLHCESNSIPDKPMRHHRSVDFSKWPRRKAHYEDGRTLNERRFDSIDRLPRIYSNSKYLGGIAFDKSSPHKEMLCPGLYPYIYNPNKEALLKKSSYALKFDTVTGRIMRDSIYKEFVPPEVEDSEAVVGGYQKLSGYRRSWKLDMESVKPRDDSMYRVTEGYQPCERENKQRIESLLESLRYEKGNH